MRQLTFDSLRAARGARRVLQQITLDFVVDRRIGFARNTFGIAVPAVQVVVGDDKRSGRPFGNSVARPSKVFRSAAEPTMALALLLSMM